MKTEIQELIKFHQEAKNECFGLLSELSQLKGNKMTQEDYDALNVAIIKAQEEYAWRGIFIQDLTNLL